MWDKHWERVDSFLKKWKMVQEGDSILLGISGGADSVCLARYFLARREALSLKLYAVHINHMLRGEEAKRDEEFVQDFCHKWNLSLNVEYRNIKEESRQKKCSEEEAGRIARYECFEKYAKEYHCGKIAVAHHQNDFISDAARDWTAGNGGHFAGQWKDYPSISLFKQGRNHGYSSKYRAELCR